MSKIETKIRRKSIIMLHRYRQLYSLRKNRRHLCTHCKDVETRFDTSNYKFDRPKGKNKKVVWLMQHELDVKIMSEFVTLRPKTSNYLTDDMMKIKK